MTNVVGGGEGGWSDSSAVYDDNHCGFKPVESAVVMHLVNALFGGCSCLETHCAGGIGNSEIGSNKKHKLFQNRRIERYDKKSLLIKLVVYGR